MLQPQVHEQLLTQFQYFTQLMKKQQAAEQSPQLKFIEAQRKEIDSNPQNALNLLKQLVEKVTDGDHIGVIIALHNGKYLENLLKKVLEKYQQKRSDQFQKNIAILHLYGYDCFFKIHPQYVPIFDAFKVKIAKIVDHKKYSDFGGENKRYLQMKELLMKFNQISDPGNKQAFERGKMINEFINKELNVAEPTTRFEECIYTYIRIQLENIQGIIREKLQEKEIGFCCRLHFEKNSKKSDVETKNQNFSKELPPIPSKRTYEDGELKEKLKRNVVSFLNSSGGIFYLGIQHNAQKEAKFTGVSVNDKEKIEILIYVLNEIVMKINPPDEEHEQENEQAENARLQKFRQTKTTEFLKSKEGFYQQFSINRFIFVDFINLYNPSTWFFSRTEGNVKEFIVRIKVKLGDPFQVYHFINEKEIPQAYLRQDKKEKKLTMMEYYDEVYRRLKNKANDKWDEPPKIHALCRFPVKDPTNNK